MSSSIQPGAALYSQGFGTVPSGALYPHLDTRAPTSTDTRYEIGKIWINTTDGAFYGLSRFTSVAGVLSADWEILGGSSSDVNTLSGDSGSASPVSGDIEIAGGAGITTSASGNTVTVALTGGGLAFDSMVPDAGTNPVVPAADGSVTMAGTAAQITTTGGLNTLTFSLPAAITAPGSLTTTTSLTAGNGFSVTTGAVTVASATSAINISADAAATTINFATGAGAKTLTVGSTDTTSSTAVQSGSGGVNLNDSNNQPTNINTGTSTGAVSIGNAAAGAVTVDTAAGISLDAATASNFTVTGAADLTAASTAGSVIVSAGEAVADAIQLTASDAAGGITLSAGTGNINNSAISVVQSLSSAGNNVNNQVTNSDNTNAASHASYQLATGGASSGDPYINFLVSGAGVYSLGIDNTDSDNFKLSANAALGTSDIVTITSAGAMETAAGITAATGDIVTTVGAMSAATTVTGGTGVTATTGDITATAGDVVINGAAQQLQVHGGTATDFIGQATLTLGTVTVANTNIAATDRVFVTRSSINGSTALGTFEVVITPATNFVINARNPTDASVQTNDISIVDYFIVRQLA